MVSKVSFLAFAAGAAAQVYYGGSSNTTTSAASATTTYACNPAHEYPEGRKCIATNGGLTLLPPTTSAAQKTTYACNPAHQYPTGVSCATISGSLTLVTASATPSSTGGCQAQYNKCRQPTNGLSANQAFCASENAKCEAKCQDEYDTCRTTRVNGLSANQAACAAQLAGCLGRNPSDSEGSNTATSTGGDSYVTQIVTAYTTYCPSPTTFAHGNKTYTVTSATTLTITNCPGGCKITTPVKSLPPATTVTAIVPHYTTECPTPTTVTIQSKTYTVTSSTVITVSCPGGCTVTTPVSKLSPPETTAPVVVPSPSVGVPSLSVGISTVRQPSSTTSSAVTRYTGAAEKITGSGALMVGILGLLAL